MATQYQIEQKVGIDNAIAAHMMRQETPAAQSAMNLLRIQCAGIDSGGMSMLEHAVADCCCPCQSGPAIWSPKNNHRSDAP